MLGALSGSKITRRLPLHPYQLDGVLKTEAAWEECDRALGVCATGGGKSLLAGELIARRVGNGERCLMLAHTRKLVSQFSEVTERDYGIWSTMDMGGSYSQDSPLVCSTVQSMVARIRDGHINPEEFSMVTWDEGHHALTATHQEIANAFPHAKHFGITATPMASGQRDLMQFFQQKAFDVSLQWLIENGYLARLENLNIPITIEVKSDTKTGDFREEEVGAAIEPYLEQCAKWIATAPEAKGKCSLVFQPLRQTSRKFIGMLKDMGVNCEHVDGEMSDYERKRIQYQLEMGEIDLVSNAMLWTEGIDIPPVNLLMNLRLTKSWVLFCQIIGRATRLFDPSRNGLPGTKWGRKDSALIVDPLWLCDEHNPMRMPALIAKDKTEAEEIENEMKKQMAAGRKGDVIEAAATAKNLREEALRARLEANAKRKSRLLSCAQFFANTHLPDWASYEPLNDLEARPIKYLTEKQAGWLQRSGLDMSSISNMGQAKKVLDTLGERFEKGLATAKQAAFAVSLGMPEDQAWAMPFAQMKEWLDKNAPPAPWKKWKK